VRMSGTLRTMKARRDWTLLYTPYLFAAAQPSPQLTMPSWVATPSVMVMSGPPLSPWHASVPPAANPAQIILSVTVRLLPGGPG